MSGGGAIAGTTRVFAVLGDPIDHTRSPAMHNAAFAALGIDAVMAPFRVEAGGLAAAVRGLAALGVGGASVTVPHKTAVVAACDRLTAAARAIGAVNCLVIRDGTIEGDNTDAPGFVAALAEATGAAAAGSAAGAATWLAGQRAVILGAGGAARAVAWGLAQAGATTIVVSRRPATPAFGDEQRAWDAAALADALASAALVVDTTPVGLHAGPDEAGWVAAIPLHVVPPDATIASLIYHRVPLLLARAQERGHRVVDGAGMLVHQAALAFARWIGQPAPLAVMRDALR